LKLLHGRETLNGKGYFFEGLTHNSYVVSYQRNPVCKSHTPFPPIYEVERSVEDTTAADTFAFARQVLSAQAVRLILNFEVVKFDPCKRCGHDDQHFHPLEAFTELDARCPSCSEMRVPVAIHQLKGDESYLHLTLRELGLPPWEIIMARSNNRAIALEYVSDRKQILGSLAAD
jgi:adenylyltransferase/sulfurtransferase